jgi:HSP20 family protein
MPTVDIEENVEEYVVKAELPGLKKEEVKITYNDGVLALQGERKQEKEEKGKKYHRIERTYGTFYRSFLIPEGVDEKKIFAEQKDGLLYIHMPKTMEKKPEEKTIEVKVR